MNLQRKAAVIALLLAASTYAGVAQQAPNGVGPRDDASVCTFLVHPTNPDVVYGLTSSGGGGATWTLTSSGLPPVPTTKLLVSPRDPSGDTVYAGT